MSKERLEEIKNKYKEDVYDCKLGRFDIQWLIEQAEQNKRYREALEYALHKIKIDINSSKMTVGEFDKICTIADYIGKTLEESE